MLAMNHTPPRCRAQEKEELEKKKTSHYNLKEEEEKILHRDMLNDLLKYNVLYTGICFMRRML
jgi:hypothetical protein